ncbi:MAG: hypothetical protein HYU75_22680 [Betaproteobacteria bacterium]|nr:hypothetical protein [Betaproteobacteria bacterium]
MQDRYRGIYDGYRWEVPADFNLGIACCGRLACERYRFARHWEGDRGATSAWEFSHLRQESNRLSNALAGKM